MSQIGPREVVEVAAFFVISFIITAENKENIRFFKKLFNNTKYFTAHAQ
jgi:hypothetical protein